MANIAKMYPGLVPVLSQFSSRLQDIRQFSSANFENIKTEVTGANNNIALITLNRPNALNSLSFDLMAELSIALNKFDQDSSINVLVLTGSEKAFAAGADIKELQNKSFAKLTKDNFLQNWSGFGHLRKPIIAAVNGYALGGGCELAMMCDIIYAGDKAQFSQSEISIGTIPGAGGTQRLTRVVGKSKAMEICLSGKRIDANEAEKLGLVSKVVPASKLIEEALNLADKISTHSPLIVAMCKEAVHSAFETTLQEGLKFERRQCHATFSTMDRKEGMTAFIEKRAPKFTSE